VPRLTRDVVQQSGAGQLAGEEIVARTESPAAASVGEDHDADSRRRDAERSVERKTFSLRGDGLIDYLESVVVHCLNPLELLKSIEL